MGIETASRPAHPLPVGLSTMLAEFDRTRTPPQHRQRIIAAGILPAALEMMDQTSSRGGGLLHVGFPTDAGRSADDRARRSAGRPGCVRRGGSRDRPGQRRPEVRMRPTPPRGRCFGRAASGRSVPSPGSHPATTQDGVIPRSSCPRCCGGGRIAAEPPARHGQRVPRRRRQPASDDPVRRARPGVMGRVLAAGREICGPASRRGAATGEHGIGIEKRDFMSLIDDPVVSLNGVHWFSRTPISLSWTISAPPSVKILLSWPRPIFSFFRQPTG